MSAKSNTAGALELIEVAYRPVSVIVGDTVDEDWFFPIGPPGDDWSATKPGNYTANVIAIVATVGDDTLASGRSSSPSASNPFKSETSPPLNSARIGGT